MDEWNQRTNVLLHVVPLGLHDAPRLSSAIWAVVDSVWTRQGGDAAEELS